MVLWKFVFLAALSLAVVAQGATVTWVGDKSNQWLDPGNWNGGVLPEPNDDVVVGGEGARIVAKKRFQVSAFFSPSTLGVYCLCFNAWFFNFFCGAGQVFARARRRGALD